MGDGTWRKPDPVSEATRIRDRRRSAPLFAAWPSTQCSSGRELATSGNRRSARLECCPRGFKESNSRRGGAVVQGIGTRMSERRRRRSQCIGYCARRHADRTAIVGEALVMMVGPAAIRRCDRRDEPVVLTAADCVAVSKRQRKVQRQRDQREQGPLPNMITKPMHLA